MKYYGYYADEENISNIKCTLSAVNKLNYIFSALNKVGIDVEVISAGSALNGKKKAEKKQLSKNISVKYFSSKFSERQFVRVIRRIIFNFKLLNWSLKNIKKKETIIVYHSLAYMWLFKILKKKKDINMILEMEEIYGDVLENDKIIGKELSYAKLADGYIFPTEQLNKKINVENKPYVIIHGTYQAEEKRISKKEYRRQHGWAENKTHVVYAGTLDPLKGGAIAAVNTSNFLTDDYHIHILGFGTNIDINNILEIANNLSEKNSCRVSYDGVLSGDEYLQFIQACDIGLSTQNPYAKFNASSFPSKILSYMANGLKVVSVRIPVVETSAIGKHVFYYNEQLPQYIADAIKSVRNYDYKDSREIIKSLDTKFTKEIYSMIINISKI